MRSARVINVSSWFSTTRTYYNEINEIQKRLMKTVDDTKNVGGIGEHNKDDDYYLRAFLAISGIWEELFNAIYKF